MRRDYYLELAASGLRMPIGTDLVLHEQDDPEAVMHDGQLLGRVVEMAAMRYRTPLAVPLMDLRLEKADLLSRLDIDESRADAFHFDRAPEESEVAWIRESQCASFGERNRAHIEAIRYVAASPGLLPIGMAIGPFSLMTKLVADPITPIALAGAGADAAGDDAVKMIERCLTMAELTVQRSVVAQIEAGARAMLICEPAANTVYLSPRQMNAGSDIFERFVMQPNLRLKRVLDAFGVDLIFHDCGDLISSIVKQFADRLDPAILSLGSSRKLWEDAAVVPERVVLFGNLPTKSFYSDSVMPAERVAEIARETVARMREAGHPHILGSECDVLHVADAAASIRNKVDVFMDCV